MNARRAATISAQQQLHAVRAAPGAPRPRISWSVVGVIASAVGVIATIGAQAAAGFLWAGVMSNRVEALERASAAQGAIMAGVPAQLATLDERSQAQGEALKHLVAEQDGQREDVALAQAVRRWAHADSGRRR